MRNILTPIPLEDRNYNISVPDYEFKGDLFIMTDTSCGLVIYSAFLDTGAPLPSFIKFNSGSIGFSIFSNNPKEKGGYNIVVKGTTKYYNASAS